MMDLKISGEIVDVRDGTHDSPKYISEGFPLITSKNLKDGKILLEDVNYISSEDFDKINKRSKVDRGDILYSMIGTIGNFSIVEKEPEYAIKNVALFKFKSDNVFNKYFYYVLSSDFVKRQIEAQQKGGTQKFVTLKILRNLKIPLPTLDTQKRIAQILDDAATLRDTTAQLLKEYDLLAQSIFLEMFGDPVVNPMGWEKVNFNKLFTQGKESKKPEDIKDGDKYIGLEHIQKGTGEILEIVELRENELKSNKFCFDSNYVLYGKLRPYLNKVAAPNFEGICSTDIIPFSPIKSKSNKAFLINLMRGEWFITYANERTSGANLPRISPKEINKFSTINPPIELQNQFADKIALIEQQKALAKQELQESEDLFNCLLQKAFKGELV